MMTGVVCDDDSCDVDNDSSNENMPLPVARIRRIKARVV